ncbi:MAG: DUF86 domain-containing protein, partial [Elusimicrobiota bacterium]|nr:DUF86 domain-containing protein [Elusimicrobiota bacterium]
MFDGDIDYQHSIAFSIAQIGELANHLSEEFVNKTKDNMPWNKIIRMRHKLIHGYATVELPVLWTTALLDIPKLHDFCNDLLKNEQNQKD